MAEKKVDELAGKQLVVSIQNPPEPPAVPLVKRIAKMIGVFLVIFLICFFIAVAFRQLTGKDREPEESTKEVISYMNMKLRPVTHLPTGTEYYCDETGDWYWMDASKEGEFAHDREVYIPYVFNEEAVSSTEGKWVRYDHEGKMIKGWYLDTGNQYYYDTVTGAMYKGQYLIDGWLCQFNEMTGILQSRMEAPGSVQQSQNTD